MNHNPDLYVKGTLVKPTAKAKRQAIGGKRGVIISRYPVNQIVTVRWEGKRGDERWHVDLLDLAEIEEARDAGS